MLKRIIICSIMATVIFAWSCIKEDVSHCGRGVEIQYYYTLNPQNTNLFEQEVHRMAIYIFDKDNLYYDYQLITDQTQLKNNHPIRLNLPSGEYTLVSWAGDPEWYNIGECPNGGQFQQGLHKGTTKLSDFRLWIQQYSQITSEQPIAEAPADLYYGDATPIKVLDDRKTHVDIGLTKDIHLLNIVVHGTGFLEPTRVQAPVPLDIYCMGKNGRYLYNNTFDQSAGELKYMPSTEQYENNKAIAVIKVMRLMQGQPMMMTIADKVNGHIYYNFDLLPYIMQSPAYSTQQEIDREYEFDIDLTIDRDLTVIMSINGWQVTNVIPQ